MMDTLFNVEKLEISKKSNEWYTPLRYIEAARDVMGGGIDLDPASCDYANKTIKASKFYTKGNNGLMQSWDINGKPSRIWINPPYGRLDPTKLGSTRSLQKFFLEKLLQEHAAGHVEQAVALMLGNACFMRWFQPLWNYPLCFHDGRIEFEREDGTQDHFGFGTIFVYIGPNETKFTEIFSRFGNVVKVIKYRTQLIQQHSLWDNGITA